MTQCTKCGAGIDPDKRVCECAAAIAKPQSWTSVILRVLWTGPALQALFALGKLQTQWDAQKSAPQQAALAGYVLATCVLPYCFMRAITFVVGRTQAD